MSRTKSRTAAAVPAIRIAAAGSTVRLVPRTSGAGVRAIASPPSRMCVLDGARVFAGLVALDLSYTGVDVEGMAQILEHHPALRVLPLGAGDEDCFDVESLQQLLAIPAIARLEHLELHRIGAHADETRALLACPQLAGLQFLAWPVDGASLTDEGPRARRVRGPARGGAAGPRGQGVAARAARGSPRSDRRGRLLRRAAPGRARGAVRYAGRRRGRS